MKTRQGFMYLFYRINLSRLIQPMYPIYLHNQSDLT